MNSVRVFVLKHPYLKMIFYPVNWVRRKYIARQASVSGETVYSNLCALLCEDPVVRVDEFQGVFQIGARSDVFRRLITEGIYEPELVELCLSYMDRDRDVVDIGANIGFFTVLFSKGLRRGRVLAVEPTSSALSRLRNNIERNEVHDSVVIYEGVVTDSEGNRDIKIVSGKEEYSSVGEMSHPSIIGEEYIINTVPSSTLDKLVSQYSLNPGLIKIDVEGMEHLVLKGADSVLNNNRPIIISELSNSLLRKNGSSSRSVVAQLEQHGYKVIDPMDPSVTPGYKEYGDILCLPRDFSNLDI